MIYISTSNSYSHVVPVFIHLAQKYGSHHAYTIVGYDKPNFELPIGFKFVSLGEQIGGSENFGTDLSKFFSSLSDELIIWCMEDSFLRDYIDESQFQYALDLMERDGAIGRISLTTQNINKYTEVYPFGEIDYGRVLQTPPKSEYRLSTMPAIWRKEFLLRYLKPNMTPWQFEVQPKVEDEFLNVAMEKPAIFHNEGVRKRNLFEYNFEGIDPAVIQEMKDKRILV